MGPINKAMLGTQIQKIQLNKVRKEGKPHGNAPPQGTMYVKKEEELQLLGNCVLHSKMNSQRMELLLSEGLGEYLCHLFC